MLIMDLKKLIAVAAMSSVLIACGGSSGGSSSKDGVFSGNTSEASLTSENQQDLAEATALGSAQAVNGDSLPSAAVLMAADNEPLRQLAEKTVALNNLPIGAAQDVSQGVCTNGGSASVNSGQSSTVITYNQCDTGFGIFSGTATLTSASDGSSTITYRNFTITVDGETDMLNATISCDAQGACTIVSDFTAANGKTYRVENSVVSGNSSSGYNVQARVYDPQHGYVNFTASNVTFNCSNGYPGSGSVSFVSAGQTASVSFDSCNGYTLTIDGVATSYTW
jgi:hypothetical protein